MTKSIVVDYKADHFTQYLQPTVSPVPKGIHLVSQGYFETTVNEHNTHMSQRKIIMLCGVKRSGKDTVAMYLTSHFAYKQLCFADSLKQACRQLFDLTVEQTDGNDKEVIDTRYGCTPRAILQFFGTEIMQYKLSELMPSVGRLFWVNKVLPLMNEPKPYVVSDMRFKHEYDLVKQMYGDTTSLKVIRIDNPRVPGCDGHESECDWMKVTPDHVLLNHGTLNQLFKQIDSIMLNN